MRWTRSIGWYSMFAVLAAACALQSACASLDRRLGGAHAVTCTGTILHQRGDWPTSNTKLPALDFLVTGQDTPTVWSTYADGHSFAGIRHPTFVSLSRWPSLRRVPFVLPRDLDLADSTTRRFRMAIVQPQRHEPRLRLAYVSDIFYLQVQEEMSKTIHDTRGATL